MHPSRILAGMWKAWNGVVFQVERLSGWKGDLMRMKHIRLFWKRMVKKSLGLDGFTIAFFKNCWDMVKHDLILVFNEFMRGE